MSPPPVRIRIGGELDGTLARALASANSQIQRAEKQAQRVKKETTNAAAAEARKQLKAQEALTRASESLDRQRSRALFAQFRAQETGAERAAKAQMQATARAHAADRREIEKTVRATARALATERREREKTAAAVTRRNANAGESFARRTSHRASRFLMPEAPIGPMVMRGLGDVARGAGIDFSVQGMVSRNVGLQQQATDLSNSGFQAGAKGPNGRRVDVAALTAQARAIGGQFGIDASEVLGGLAQYQKIAGDLDTGRQTLFQMAALSKATGTNLEDMAAATANVSNGLGDIPNKGEVIDEVMRTIAGQGKLGAVEISDMATQMARIAAAASNFSGNRAKNIQQFGALAQIARAEGGAPSAAEAARSMGGFANTLKKSARINAFKKEGIDVFTDSSKTALKDPIELIKASLLATGGDLQRMNKLFMDVVGARTVGGLQKTFIGAGGGQAGLDKVDEQIARMMKAQVSKDEVKESAKRASETTAAKAARFQNELDKVTEGVMANLVPALEDAGSSILKWSKVVGGIATWAVSNPKTAIAGAITASIARAGIESAFRSGIERLILGPTGPGGAGTRAAGIGSAAAALGGALTIASLAASVITAASIYAENLYDETSREFSEGAGKGDQADRLTKQIQDALAAGDLKSAEKLAKKQVQLHEEAATGISNSEKFSGFGAFVNDLARGATKTFIPGGEETIKQSDQAVINMARDQLIAANNSKALLAEIRDAILNAPQPPGAPPGGQASN